MLTGMDLADSTLDTAALAYARALLRKPARRQKMGPVLAAAAFAALSAVTFADSAGKSETRRVDGVFLCIGGNPRTEWCSREHVLTDARGYILTGRDMSNDGRLPDCWPLQRDPFPLETSRVGLFAAGDVRHGSTKRVAAAVGEGSMVASLIFSRLAELGVTY
jgi:thioredoxin reductase (NADPH)